ncbi:MAG: hypothetical protein COT73_04320 [Bdellovibrio sp. CG10_big_fil_rev_8_21_14_0_10_47_8]|nr:MAG: hypothetical protein COT73_04320 [Bdellovibrio sp. CG10_big_fil_rev_8_21_14_0_10_47_8]
MSESEIPQSPSQMLEEILAFVGTTTGLSSKIADSGQVTIQQAIDGKLFRFKSEQLTEVLQRVDADGKQFIQVNFQTGTKVLFTDTLVGFKPRETLGLDMAKIPRVVTTPDLISVFEAIEESLSSDSTPDTEIEILKRVFVAILHGGEAAGFDLAFERRWLARLVPSKMRASA